MVLQVSRNFTFKLIDKGILETFGPSGFQEIFKLIIVKLTGFQSQVGIREGLQRTIDWIVKSDNLKNYKSEIYNV